MAGKLYEVLCKNAELSKKFVEASSKEEAFAVVKDVIPDYTIEEMVAELKENQKKISVVSDDELESVSGGTSTEEIYISDEEFFKQIFKKVTWFFDTFF